MWYDVPFGAAFMRTLHTPHWPSTPFILVLGMLIRVCHIVTQSSSLGLTTVSLLPRKIHLPSPWYTYFTRPLPPRRATRGVLRPPLRLGD
ncbi:unnamed protein product [Protopolystoma xenopodis]|uniref:Uncharacterized protein n=1 Tax=Protopolystoma xenopodis TaxID=117903 RepID=A0A448XK14_9PLAT|nr:unnamed protein product [Protopolystoma xenopodis]